MVYKQASCLACLLASALGRSVKVALSTRNERAFTKSVLTKNNSGLSPDCSEG